MEQREVPETVTGTEDTLDYLLRPYGIMRRAVRLERGWYRDAAGAMLGKRSDDGTAVALLPSGLSGYSFYDRRTGRTVRVSRRFREKSVERISSPEDLDDYIRVTTPSVWIVLAAILILLIGMLAWSVFGTVEVPVGNGSVESVHPISFVIQ